MYLPPYTKMYIPLYTKLYLHYKGGYKNVPTPYTKMYLYT